MDLAIHAVERPHIVKAVERGRRLTHQGAFAVKAGDFLRYYGVLLLRNAGFWLAESGQSRPGYAAELEKLKPAKDVWRLGCSPCAEGWLSNGEGRMIER